MLPRVALTAARRRVVLAALLVGTAALPAAFNPAAPRAAGTGAGYWGVATDGGVFSFGDAGFFGSTGALRLNQPIVGMAPTVSGAGYWLVASDGGIFAFGDARFFGSTGAMKLNRPVVGMAPTPTGGGYWLVANDGGIFAFGDARFFGSTGSTRLNKPITGMAATPTGRGYWLVATDGGIFAFGDARFHGSTGDKILERPIQGMAATPTGRGYWFVANDGGVFTFGDAGFFGAGTDRPRRGARKVVGMAPTPSGRGYWLATAKGEILAFGDAPDLGGATELNLPFVGMATMRPGATAGGPPAVTPGASAPPGSPAPAPPPAGPRPDRFAMAANPTWGTAPAKDRAGNVLRMVESGDALYLAGEFTGFVPPGTPEGENDGMVTRNFLAAVSPTTGDLLPFDPDPDGPVRGLALAPDGRRLYIGGSFGTVGGTPARSLAAIDLATGGLDATFTPPRLNSGVRTVALWGDRLYVGGNFTEVLTPTGPVERPQIAAFDASTGALLDWLPPDNDGGEFFGQTGEEKSSGNGVIYDLAVSGDGSRLYAAGTFLDFAGQKGVVSLDTASGQATEWQPKLDRPVFGLDVWPGDGQTLFAATGGAGGMLVAFEPGGDREGSWSIRTDGDNMDVVATAQVVYLAGHYDYIVEADSDCYQRCPDGDPRRHLAAFDARTGDLDAWSPTANTSTGPYSAHVGARHLWVGGEFSLVNRQPQPGIAQFPAA